MIGISDGDPSAFAPSAAISLKLVSFPETQGSSRLATLGRLHGVMHQTRPSGGAATTLGRMIQRACHRQCRSCAACPSATSRAGACPPPCFTAPARRLVSWRPQPVPNPLASSRRRSICSLAAAALTELLRSSPGIRHYRGHQAALSIN